MALRGRLRVAVGHVGGDREGLGDGPFGAFRIADQQFVRDDGQRECSFAGNGDGSGDAVDPVGIDGRQRTRQVSERDRLSGLVGEGADHADGLVEVADRGGRGDGLGDLDQGVRLIEELDHGHYFDR
ncbi:MAG TPA: hypothetical protein VGX23_13870 [Actinocrinis sp.]|nr:hypothetical protein [Actinocrinis sp.]